MSTVTNYSNNIDVTYPIPGVDNDTQGFRNNFSNIKNALKTTSDELTSLQLTALRTDSSVNDFAYNTIKRPTFQSSGELVPNTINIGSDTSYISFLDGNYQKLSVGISSVISFSDWPSTSVNGKLRLEIFNATTTTDYTVNFSAPSLKHYQPLVLPYTVTSASNTSPVIFDLWSTDNGATVFVDLVVDTSASVDYAGIITTPAQPNITSVGVLTGLDVNGVVNATNFVGTLTGIITTPAQPNITSVGVLTSLQVSGNITGALQTAAQPNITSVGTLTSVDVNGALTAGSFTVPTAAQPNITSVGALTDLSIDSGTSTAIISVSGRAMSITGVDTIALDSSTGIYYVSSQPTSSKGASGDRKGMIFATGYFMFLCYADYTDGVDNIWAKIATVTYVWP